MRLQFLINIYKKQDDANAIISQKLFHETSSLNLFSIFSLFEWPVSYALSSVQFDNKKELNLAIYLRNLFHRLFCCYFFCWFAVVKLFNSIWKSTKSKRLSFWFIFVYYFCLSLSNSLSFFFSFPHCFSTHPHFCCCCCLFLLYITNSHSYYSFSSIFVNSFFSFVPFLNLWLATNQKIPSFHWLKSVITVIMNAKLTENIKAISFWKIFEG